MKRSALLEECVKVRNAMVMQPFLKPVDANEEVHRQQLLDGTEEGVSL